MKKWIFAAVAAVVAALVVPVSAAAAATAYTWIEGWQGNGDSVPGADHESWDNPNNWSPQGIPGAGDTVLVTNAPSSRGFQSSTDLEVPAGGVSVAKFTIEERSGGSVYLTGGTVTVTGSFSWTGGTISAPVRIAPSASGQIGAGPLKPLHAKITVDGSLTLNNIGAADGHQLQLYPDNSGDNDGITVTKKGTLTANGKNFVTGTECCTDPAHIVNKGAMTVTSGTTTFSEIQFEQLGTITVAKKARLVNTGGPARLGSGAKYAGGGTLEFTETAKIAANPDKDPVPGGILMLGKGKMSGGTHLLFGQGAKLTGVGSFTGKGAIDFTAKKNSAQQAATVYGSLKTGPKVKVSFGGAHPAVLGVFNTGLKGYHGVLTIAGKATVAKKKTFVAAAGTKTTVKKGGTLVLKPGSTFGTGDCCTHMATLTIARGATLSVPKAGQAKATVLRAKLVMKGKTKPANGHLVVRR